MELPENQVELFEAFFQKNHSKYLDRLADYRDGKKFTFNVFPFLFGIFWFAYRKMYLESTILFVIIISESLLENFVFLTHMDPASLRSTSLVVSIAFATVTGFLGNYLYLRKAEKTVAFARENYRSEEDQKAFLAEKGGVKLLSPLIVVLLIIFYYVLSEALYRI